MPTQNSWNNQVNDAYNQIILNAGTNGVAISTDAAAATVNVATGGAVKTATFGSVNTTSATTIQSGSGALNITSTNGAQTHNSGTGAMSISTDASATTVNIATGGAVKTSTFGSVNTTSATTVQSGSGALNITATNGALTINSGTGTLSIANDATAQTVNIATGAGAKLVTLGTTNGASSLALKTGTADFSLASATGTIIAALDTGEVTKPLQPAFLAYAPSSQTDVTGDGTLYTVTFTTEVFDSNADFDGTSTFTAPVTGKYLFSVVVYFGGLVAANSTRLTIVATSGTQQPYYQVATANDGGFLAMNGTFFVNMTAADTCVVKAYSGAGTKVVDVVGAAAPPYYSTFGGFLVC